MAVLKVYMDKTGTHDESPIVAVSAYIGRPRSWRSWTKKWNVAKRPIKVFHSTDCANYRGEFDGWNQERRDAFVAGLLPIIRDHEFCGLIIGVQMEDFRKALGGYPELVTMFGSPYGPASNG